jgi:single-strand DNA-binding protein
MSIHKIIAVGYLGRDPEMKYLPSGTAVVNFSIATDRVWTNTEGEKVKVTSWFRVSVFGKMAENCNQYLRKGSQVFVEGHLTSDPTTGGPKVFTRQDGTIGSSYELFAETVNFLSKAPSNDSAEGATQTTLPTATAPAGEEDVPF